MQIEIVMPKMGESIIEATILRWVKKVGETVEMDEPILEIATDKVDSEVPSPVTGVLTKILFEENAVVAVGTCIAYLETQVEGANPTQAAAPSIAETTVPSEAPQAQTLAATAQLTQNMLAEPLPKASESSRFYSPLVRTIAKEEKISVVELDNITGSGQGGRVTKSDVMQLVEQRKNGITVAPVAKVEPPQTPSVGERSRTEPTNVVATSSVSGNVEIIEMDRMRRLIADHMVMSKHTSPHVTSFVEADVTNLVNWRNHVKGEYKKKYNENITFTPIFIEAVCKALRDFPMVNSSVEGTKILVKKDLNIGMAAALPSGNLIVPVIKNADHLNLVGLTKKVNDLANRARQNQLKPDEIQGGTFTLTNVGSFGNVMGTPIINQPQVAILAVGAIKKKPAVLETEYGDVIAVRQMMFLSLSYDHRVVDGMLGGSFLRRVADYLEQFDPKRDI